VTALTLGKNYTQDEALDWGLATRPERRRHLRLPRDSGPPADAGEAGP
jgi:hypothetical protein